MICSNCHAQNPVGFAYCGSCGNGLAVAKSPMSETRRQVAVLFADVVGFTSLAEKLDPEDLRFVVGDLLSQLATEVYAHDGRVDMYAGDSIMATFGAPTIHENDPALACQAALCMLEKVGKQDKSKGRTQLQIRVGINWGEVIYGRIADSDRFTVLGDAVNIASRLQSAAQPGTIYVSDSVMTHTAHQFSFLPIGELAVKNREKPVGTYMLQGEKKTPERDRGIRGKKAVWVNREREIAFIGEWFLKLRTDSGKNNILLITGDGGVGKSRLWEESYRRLPVRSHRRITTRCHSYNYMVPLATVSEFLKVWLGLPARSNINLIEATIREHLASLRLDPHGVESEILLLVLTGVARGNLADMDAQVRLEVLEQTLGTILNKETEHYPLLIEFDDFHWADEQGGQLFLRVLQKLQQCGSVIISRQADNLKSIPTEISRLHIDSLPPTLALQMIRVLLGGEITDLADKINNITQGNPYYIEEIIKHLIDNGQLVIDPVKGPVLTSPLEETPLPQSLVVFITQKVDGCSVEARSVLAALSVLEEADVEMIVSISGIKDISFVIEELKTQFLIEQLKNGCFVTSNDLIKEAVLKGVLLQYRRLLHSKTADLLIERHIHGEDQLATIIHHLLEAERNEEAIPWILETGNRAMSQGAIEAALIVFRQALLLLGETSDFHLRLRATMRETQALLETCQPQEVLRIIKDISIGYCTMQEKAELAVLKLSAILQIGDLRLAKKIIPSCLAQEKHLTPATKALLHLHIAQTLARSQKLEEAREQAKLSLSWGRNHADLSVAANAYNALGIISGYLGHNIEALHYLRFALKLRRRLGKVDDIAATLSNIAMTYTNLDLPRLVPRYANEAIEYARRSGDKYVEGTAELSLGHVALSSCQWEIAEMHYKSAYRLFDSINALNPRVVTKINLALIRKFRGEFGEAINSLSQQKTELLESEDLVHLQSVNRELAQLNYLQGDFEKSQLLSRECLKMKTTKKQKDDQRFFWQLDLCDELILSRGKGLNKNDYNRISRLALSKKQPTNQDFLPILLHNLYNAQPTKHSIIDKLKELKGITKDKRNSLVFSYLYGISLLSSGNLEGSIKELSNALAKFRRFEMNYYTVVCGLHLARAFRLDQKQNEALLTLSLVSPSLKIITNQFLASVLEQEKFLSSVEKRGENEFYVGQI